MNFSHADLAAFFAHDSREEPVAADGTVLFSESHFELQQGDWTVHISFSNQAPVVMADLHHAGRPEPVTTAEVQHASHVRIHTHGRILDVLSHEVESREGGASPRVILSITKDPLTLSTFG